MGRGEGTESLEGAGLTARGTVAEALQVTQAVPEILALWEQYEKKDQKGAAALLDQPVTLDHPALEGGPSWRHALQACRTLRDDQLQRMDENPDSLVATVFSGNCSMMINALRARL